MRPGAAIRVERATAKRGKGSPLASFANNAIGVKRRARHF